MEVHAHTHSARKKWTHYFFEFFMLFLAVFCGFLAEYKLEQTIERHREKEFILSMYEDATLDTANINKSIQLNHERIKYADSLAVLCFHYDGSQQDRTDMYKAQRGCIYYPDLVYPTDRTLFQLKNSGGMRLIRNKNAVESIIAYDNSGRKLVNQQSYYEKYLNEATGSSSHLMNFLQLFNTDKPWSTRYDAAELVNPDKQKLVNLGNSILMFKGVMLQYIVRLKEMEKEALLLMSSLKTEYKLN